jgi:two-component system cell cycle sensor histidine kinase/response regulator CckA
VADTGKPSRKIRAELETLSPSADPLKAFKAPYASTLRDFGPSQDLYYHLVENSLGLICIHDLTGILQYVNPAAAHSLGYRREDGFGQNLSSFLAPAVRHLFSDYLERIACNSTDTGLMRLLTTDGKERIWLYRNILFNEPGMPPLVLGHGLDVTDLKLAKDELRESYRQLETIVAQRTADLRNVNEILEVEAAERRKAEKALKLQALTFQHISDAVILNDEEGKIIDWNPAAERIFGYSKAEAMGKQVSMLDPPNESAGLARTILTVLERDGRWSGEIPFVRKDGSRGLRETIIVPVKNQRGEPIATVGVNRDITDRSRAEQALRSSEELFRLLVENSSDIVFILDEKGILEFVSPSVERVLGYKPSELLGSSSLHLLPAEQAQAAFTRIGACLAGDSPAIREYECRHADGSSRMLEVIGRPFRDSAGRNCLVVNARDTTRRREAEQSLRRSEERYRSLFERNLAGVIHCTLSGELVACNDAFANMLGYSKEEIGTLRVDDLYYNREDRLAYLDNLTRHKMVTNYEICFRRKQGGRVWVLANASLTEENPDCSAVIVGTAIDITERKYLEDQLRHSQKMEAVGRLAGGVAHDFNNLLTVVAGYTDIVLDTIAKDTPAAWQMEEIKKAAERAAALTRQLLAFSRRQQIEPAILDLNTVVAGVHNMLRRVIGPGVELVTILHGAPGWIKADTGQVEQVLVNLVVNAGDAMHNGGKLTIELSNRELSNRESDNPAERAPRTFVVLSVTDTGCGMTPEVLSRAFEPFFTTKSRGKGTGLGLAIVYGIVKQSGGFVQATSEPGGGATFEIYLPLVKEASEVPRLSEPCVSNLNGSETVLVVEDESMVRRMVREVLEHHGYRVLEAANGAEALAVLKQTHESVDVILTDVIMPLLGGRQLIEQAITLYPRLKILYMSGYTEDSIVQEDPLDRNIAFIGKPFAPEALARKVRAVLDTTLDTST